MRGVETLPTHWAAAMTTMMAAWLALAWATVAGVSALSPLSPRRLSRHVRRSVRLHSGVALSGLGDSGEALEEDASYLAGRETTWVFHLFVRAQPMLDHLYTTTTIHLTRNGLPPRSTP